jgi:hypothetical protein
MEGETLECVVEEVRAPTLKRGALVLRDNCPSPKRDESEDLLDARGAGILVLPASSPALHPIEPCWSNVTARLRTLKPRPPADVLAALVDAFATVTGHDIQGWFRPCGYQVAFT